MLPAITVNSGYQYVDPPIADEREYGTIAFSFDFMSQTIGTGLPLFDRETGEFKRFDPMPDVWVYPHEIHPACTLQLGVWLEFVPVAYREDIEAAALKVGERFKGMKADRWLLPDFIEQLRRWIFSHVAPTNEHRPRSERWARMWREVGVRAAHRQGRITDDEAWRMLDF